MAETVSGFPFWELRFDKEGKAVDDAALQTFLREVKDQGLTDLFVFSHGWNNDPATARKLYKGFFGEVRKLLDDSGITKQRQAKVGTAGVIWPSILFPDEEKAANSGGGAASFGGGLAGEDSSGDFFTELRKVFVEPGQQPILDDLERLLNERRRSDAALREFKDKLDQLLAGSEIGSGEEPASEDNLEQRGIVESDDPRELFEALSENETSDDSGGGAAGLGDAFGRLWDGAKGALRVTTYYQMKARAGVVGKKGLGPLLGRLHQQAPDVRIHLLGHSFGARLVSYSLSGLPIAEGGKSPVKSLFLLQGAFSHFTFADALPFDRRRKGDLAGMASRVDGPLLTTHSLLDLAVGKAYPTASIIARQDASAAGDVVSRWGAMGNDGAQAVNAGSRPLSRPGTAYPLQDGRWLNLDGNQVIVNGGPPSGSHSDIVHPETAWAALVAAKIV